MLLVRKYWYHWASLGLGTRNWNLLWKTHGGPQQGLPIIVYRNHAQVGGRVPRSATNLGIQVFINKHEVSLPCMNYYFAQMIIRITWSSPLSPWFRNYHDHRDYSRWSELSSSSSTTTTTTYHHHHQQQHHHHHHHHHHRHRHHHHHDNNDNHDNHDHNDGYNHRSCHMNASDIFIVIAVMITHMVISYILMHKVVHTQHDDHDCPNVYI